MWLAIDTATDRASLALGLPWSVISEVIGCAKPGRMAGDGFGRKVLR